MIQTLIGAERLIAVRAPIWYRSHRQLRIPSIVATGLFCIIALSISFAIAYTNRDDSRVPYYCGRKAAFTHYIGTFVYIFIVVGYVIAFGCNSFAYSIASKQRINSSQIRARQLGKIRCLLIISFVSVILVSIPNLISLTSSWIRHVDDVISKPAVWATCINASINVFVYLLLNEEFRRQCTRMMNNNIRNLSKCRHNDDHLESNELTDDVDTIRSQNILLS